MDDLDREQYITRRLPKVRTDRGPSAEWMAYLEELHSRVAPLRPVVDEVESELPFTDEAAG